MAGIRRDAPDPQKRAATLTVLRELLAPIPDDLRGQRDRALLLVGFAGALRRSELAGILLGDLERTDRGYELTLKRSKGSQTEAVLVACLWQDRVVPGARAGALARRRRDHRRAGVPARLAAATPPRTPPPPCPRSAPSH